MGSEKLNLEEFKPNIDPDELPQTSGAKLAMSVFSEKNLNNPVKEHIILENLEDKAESPKNIWLKFLLHSGFSVKPDQKKNNGTKKYIAAKKITGRDGKEHIVELSIRQSAFPEFESDPNSYTYIWHMQVDGEDKGGNSDSSIFELHGILARAETQYKGYADYGQIEKQYLSSMEKSGWVNNFKQQKRLAEALLKSADAKQRRIGQAMLQFLPKD